MPDEHPIQIYTDGACSGNPGPGGWGAVLIYKAHTKTLHGGEPETTNNRMEILAAIKALNALKQASYVHLTTDSQYLRLGITTWMANWKSRGWQTAAKKPVKNRDLWEQLDLEVQRHRIDWFWVKGHSGDRYNEQADALARAGLESIRE